ncbi:CesT family type III secretion system chaperone [Vibrio sagamiensis]|uniref:YopE regulator n=1 Tax=Vibrio sagamiensis NBRC 104589 TaxID=1219064 RepID=A0A511QMF2_9VIBR
MNKQYIKAIEMLCLKCGLEVPKKISEITSLKVGEQECHITEHPTGRLLMFSSLDQITPQNFHILLEVSIFSQEEKKPIVGFDSEKDAFVLWNHQPIVQADCHTLYQQLELLSQYYDYIQEKLNDSDLDYKDSVEARKNLLNTGLFRV